jgi:phosphoribosyl-AMP cyclohydrolase
MTNKVDDGIGKVLEFKDYELVVYSTHAGVESGKLAFTTDSKQSVWYKVVVQTQAQKVQEVYYLCVDDDIMCYM